MFKKSLLLLTSLVLATQATVFAASAPKKVSIAGKDARLQCEIDKDSGEVSLVIDLTGLAARPRLVENLELRSLVGKESWNDSTRMRRECEERRQELQSRDLITGSISYSNNSHCVCVDEVTCLLEESQQITFSVPSTDGYSYYSFQAGGSRTLEHPACEPTE